jgi:nucleoside-diphosphate kinase
LDGLSFVFYLAKELFVERTLVIIKPDAVQRGLIGQIVHRFERRGLRIAALKFMQITPDLARRHYAVHEGKPFYEPLVAYITSGPVAVMILEGKDAIQVARRTMGATNPAQADPGTIRADFSIEVGRNLVHGSDGPETATFEVALFFSEDEIVSWKRDLDPWILE